MSIIGTFSKTADGYVGVIRTMTIKVKAKIVANDKNGNDKAPDFRIFAGGAELGAAWRTKRHGDGGGDFLRVELDDPVFERPLRAALFDGADGETCALVWSRRRTAGDDQSLET